MFRECTEQLERLIWGPLWMVRGRERESLIFQALLCNLRPRFIPKGRVGCGYRAVARNGRVLLASNLPLDALAESVAAIRIQSWQKVILPGDRLEPFGILICARCPDPANHSGLPVTKKKPIFEARLSADRQAPVDLGLDVGGGMSLVFLRNSNHVHMSHPVNDCMKS